MSTKPAVIVYKAVNLVNGHSYIGYSARGLARRERQHRAMARQGRGHHLHAAMRKYGDENFVFETIADFQGDEELAKAFECEAILGWKPQYNISYGGDGHHVSSETRKKIGDANRGKVASAETRAKQRAARLGQKHTLEHRQNISAGNKGKLRSEETKARLRGRVVADEVRAKLAAANTGKTHSDLTREKIRLIRLGTKASEETKRRMSAALRGKPAHNKGTSHSAETKAKMRAAQLGKVRSEEARANMRAAQVVNRKPVRCTTDGRVFASSSDAEHFYGLCKGAVTRVVTGRIKSTKGLYFERIVSTP